MPLRPGMKYPFRYFKTSPEVIHLALLMYIWILLSLRHIEDILHERGIDICYETVRTLLPSGSSSLMLEPNSTFNNSGKISLI